MRNFLLAAVATAAIASPAMARDGSPYVGVDVGVMAPKDTSINLDLGFPDCHPARHPERADAFQFRR